MSGLIKVLGLAAEVFKNQYRECAEVYSIFDKHIIYSNHNDSECIMDLTLVDCYLTYNTKYRHIAIHLFDESGDDEYVMNLKSENFREVVII